MVERAKAASYRVEGVYIGTDSPEINAERIDHRVKTNTDHHVDAERLPERYRFSLSNLRKTAELFDALDVVDNSDHDEEWRPFPRDQIFAGAAAVHRRGRGGLDQLARRPDQLGAGPVIDIHTFLPGEVTHPLTTKVDCGVEDSERRRDS